jgi:hypothetical protein
MKSSDSALGPVIAPPGPTAAILRLPEAALPLPQPHFRILTYNILADQYAATDFAQNVSLLLPGALH